MRSLLRRVTDPNLWYPVTCLSITGLQFWWCTKTFSPDPGLNAIYVPLVIMLWFVSFAAVCKQIGEVLAQFGPLPEQFEVTILGGFETFEGPDGEGPCHGAARCSRGVPETEGVRAILPPLVVRIENGRYTAWPINDESMFGTIPVGEMCVLDLGSSPYVEVLPRGSHLPAAGAGRWRSQLYWPMARPSRRDIWACFRTGDRLLLSGAYSVDTDVAALPSGFRSAPACRIVPDSRTYANTGVSCGATAVDFGEMTWRQKEHRIYDGVALYLLVYSSMFIVSLAAILIPETYEEVTRLSWWTGLLPWAIQAALIRYYRARWARYRSAWPWHGPAPRFEEAGPDGPHAPESAKPGDGKVEPFGTLDCADAPEARERAELGLPTH